jgi:hypothetical protein
MPRPFCSCQKGEWEDRPGRSRPGNSISDAEAATNQQPTNYPHDTPAMALNWTMIDEARNPVPLPFEMMIKTMEGAELSLTIPEAPPSGSATSGGSGGIKNPKSTGRIWLTDQRVE